MNNWNTICQQQDLLAGVGVCALHQGQQVAVFLAADGNALYALSNYDAVAQANVMSRGLIGSAGEDLYIASPVYKQRYNLLTGQCLDDDTLSLETFTVRASNNSIQLLIEPHKAPLQDQEQEQELSV